MVAAVKTGARQEQVRVEVRTGLQKRSETGLGLGGWSEVRSYLRTGQHRRRREQGLDARGRSEGERLMGVLFGEIKAGQWKLENGGEGSQEAETKAVTETGRGCSQDHSSEPVPPPKLWALTSLSAGPRPGKGGVQVRQAQTGMSLRPELGDPEVAEAMHGAPEGPGIPWRTQLRLRLPESPSLTIAAAILDPRVAVMTSAEVVFPWLRRSTPRGAPYFSLSCSCGQERQRRLSS